MRIPRPVTGTSQRRPARDLPWLTVVVQLGAFIVILGIPDGVLGVLWPSMRASFHLALDDLGVLTIASAVLYFAGGLIANQVRARLGGGNAMVASFVVALVGLVAWTEAPSWLLLLVAVAVLGLSRGVIDAVLNAEAALDGGVRRLGLLHGSWAIGGTLGPLMVAAVLVWVHDWRVAVAVIAGAVLLLAPFALADRRQHGQPVPAGSSPAPASPCVASHVGERDLASGELSSVQSAGAHKVSGPDASVGDAVPVGYDGVVGRRRLVLTIAVFVAYTAAESGPIAWGYTYLIYDRHVSRTLAAVALAGFWAALTVGRFGLAVFDDRMAGTTVLEASCLLMIAGTGLFWILPGALAIVGLPIAGLGAAAPFPMLVAMMPGRLGEAATGHAVGASIAAGSLAGPAAVAVFGVLAAHLGVGALGACLFVATVVSYGMNRVLTLATAEGAP